MDQPILLCLAELQFEPSEMILHKSAASAKFAPGVRRKQQVKLNQRFLLNCGAGDGLTNFLQLQTGVKGSAAEGLQRALMLSRLFVAEERGLMTAIRLP